MSAILVGTEHGIHVIAAPPSESSGAGRAPADAFQGRSIHALVRGGALADGDGAIWALVDGREIWRVERTEAGLATALVAASQAPDLRCLHPWNDVLLAGAAGAHLLRLQDGELHLVQPFESVEGRETWGTPWGAPPDVRSIASSADGTLYVNVHVGGVVRSDDEGQSFLPTLPVDVDVHQVVVPPSSRARVVAATGMQGLAESTDHGRTWEYFTDGMHATYCRAVTVADGTVLVSCSRGPSGKEAALYRRPLGAPRAVVFEHVREGVPEWHDDNIDTGCLDSIYTRVAYGTSSGEVFWSEDAGRSFRRAASGLPGIRAVLIL
ncbi:hypothetical protein SOCE26_001610 [Sorangium cellulosum]|uniref:Sortilin N-terminal domain-containing protein n=1 Tax=Sorangium cellulosum TaxID=56 RepID=A0A2L0EHM5_SORCE|nr:hypothetical protein [Sorangium cellulosum]AUX38783.1 hypothetical protein SOCE26_001610 [Sorangium cellulosum]